MAFLTRAINLVGAVVGGIIGTGFLIIFFLVFGVLSTPLNVVAIMRLAGWEWWTALIGTVIFGIIPLIGQICYIIFTILGPIYLINAGFSWQVATGSSPGTISFSQMTPEQFAKFKRTIPSNFSKECKQDALHRMGVEGKIPTAVNSFYECCSRIAAEVLTQDDLIYEEKTGNQLPETTAKVKEAVISRCNR